MTKNLTIRKFIAALLMLVFSFSITPTIVLHNWVADHTDVVKKVNDGSSEQITKQRFYCQCDHIVAESPFTNAEEIHLAVPEQCFIDDPGQTIIAISVSPNYHFSLRGPPAV